MPIGSAERRTEREPRLEATFGEEHAAAAADLFDLLELAWHDCYGEVTPPEQVVDDILTVSGGTLAGLAQAARLAVIDRRDLRLAADDLR